MQFDLPLTFRQRMEALLGTEAEAFLLALRDSPSAGLRLNTLKLGDSVADGQQPRPQPPSLPFSLSPTPWCPEGYILFAAPEQSPGRHPFHAAGLYYLQDPSAMAAAVLLDPQPGERVLDLCAAPGGKATHLAARMRDQGVLVVNEFVRGRLPRLVENLERFGISNVIVTNASAAKLAAVWPERFDHVLVDAPCSGEGMFRKSAPARRDWSEAGIQGCALRQSGLLAAAAALLRPGGRLVYSTCTFAPEENEAVIARFLREHPEFTLVAPPPLAGFDRGRPEWLEPALARGLPLERCVRIWPHRAPGDGHFFAILEKEGDASPYPLRPAPGRLDKKALALLQSFWEETLGGELPRTGWAQYGDWLHLLPVAESFWEDLRPVCAGLRVGGLQRGRFLPHQALALSVFGQKATRKLSFAVDDPQVRAYLCGETLRREGEKGWVLVCVDDFPLGWGKRSQGIVKNHYPRGLRWRG